MKMGLKVKVISMINEGEVRVKNEKKRKGFW